MLRPCKDLSWETAPVTEMRSWHSSGNPKNYSATFYLKQISFIMHFPSWKSELFIWQNNPCLFDSKGVHLLWTHPCCPTKYTGCSSASTPRGGAVMHGHAKNSITISKCLPVCLYEVGPLRVVGLSPVPEEGPSAMSQPYSRTLKIRSFLSRTTAPTKPLDRETSQKEVYFFKEHKGKNRRLLFHALLFREPRPHFAPWLCDWLDTAKQQGQFFHCGKLPCLYWSRKPFSSSSSLTALFPV